MVRLSDGTLAMTWSSWSQRAYAVGVAVSESGTLAGPWKHLDTPLYPENGGHGMLFTDRDGKLWFTLRTPNDRFKEHPVTGFIVDHSRAFDRMAARAVRETKPFHPNVKLILLLPYYKPMRPASRVGLTGRSSLTGRRLYQREPVFSLFNAALFSENGREIPHTSG